MNVLMIGDVIGKPGRKALAALKAAEPEIMRGVSKGAVHKNTGSRKVSRLTKRVAKLGK